MQKTPEQIYQEVELRWENARVLKRAKLRTRIGEVFTLVPPLAFFVYWSSITKFQVGSVMASLAVLSFGWAQFTKRWALEDRIEALEAKIRNSRD